ncbi:MAG TPA: phosphocholine cytidylyltransferase family protein [Candidatus Acidoferrum sp.]|nr:phosphocholine cytidylyltransferase family protein [Candidatus Acidoferrum sp.]
MKAVILAAGTSTRLRPFTDHMPKCLLPVAGVPMLERSIRNLLAVGLRELVIVTGFQEERLRGAVQGWFPGLAIEFVSNPDYATTNNADSLILARATVARGPFLLLDSDIVYDAPIAARAATAGETCLALRPSSSLGGEEVKVQVDAAGRVLAIGKDVHPACAAGESVGIEWFSPDATARLFATLERRIVGQGRVGEYYEAAFQEMIDGGCAMRAFDISPFYASEVDTPEDLEAVEVALALRGRAIAPAGDRRSGRSRLARS